MTLLDFQNLLQSRQINFKKNGSSSIITPLHKIFSSGQDEMTVENSWMWMPTFSPNRSDGSYNYWFDIGLFDPYHGTIAQHNLAIYPNGSNIRVLSRGYIGSTCVINSSYTVFYVSLGDVVFIKSKFSMKRQSGGSAWDVRLEIIISDKYDFSNRLSVSGASTSSATVIRSYEEYYTFTFAQNQGVMLSNDVYSNVVGPFLVNGKTGTGVYSTSAIDFTKNNSFVGDYHDPWNTTDLIEYSDWQVSKYSGNQLINLDYQSDLNNIYETASNIAWQLNDGIVHDISTEITENSSVTLDVQTKVNDDVFGLSSIKAGLDDLGDFVNSVDPGSILEGLASISSIVSDPVSGLAAMMSFLTSTDEGGLLYYINLINTFVTSISTTLLSVAEDVITIAGVVTDTAAGSLFQKITDTFNFMNQLCSIIDDATIGPIIDSWGELILQHIESRLIDDGAWLQRIFNNIINKVLSEVKVETY